MCIAVLAIKVSLRQVPDPNSDKTDTVDIICHIMTFYGWEERSGFLAALSGRERKRERGEMEIG